MSDPETPPSPLQRPPPFVTFYSFKGGVGRSMAVINVAGIVAARGFRVLVIDMDLEAPGISYLTHEATSGRDGVQPGFVDVLLDAVLRGEEADLFTLSAEAVIDRYAARYELPEEFRRDASATLTIMPAGRLDDDYARRLDRLDLPTLYREGAGLALVQAFKHVVQESRRFDYVFIDSRTGFSDESGICTRDLADALMIVSGLNKQNVEGTTQFLAALRGALPESAASRPMQVIFSPVPNGEDALVDAREQAARASFAAAWTAEIPCDLQIPYHPQLALTEEPHIFRRRRGYLFEAYHQIERRLLRMLGDSPEGMTERATAAFSAGEHEVALGALRHAQLLADSASEWIDGFALKLAGQKRLPVGGALRVYEVVVRYASDEVRSHLASVFHDDALKRWDEEGALDDVEGLFKVSLEADPTFEPSLGNFANFLWFERRDLDRAEALYQLALDVAPKDVINVGNFGAFRLATGKVAEGLALVERALARLARKKKGPSELDAECWMYVYCCAPPERHPAALARLHALITVHNITTGSWNFTDILRQAERLQHPEATWLPLLAEVLASRRPASDLDPWPAWQTAGP